MKKFTLLTAFVVLVSFAFAQVVGVHTPTKDKQKFEKVQKEENMSKVDPYVAWEVTFEEDPAVWTIAHDEGESDWLVSDTTITGFDYENCVDFNDDWLPCGTMVSSMWLYCGHRDVGEYSESGGNFAWIDGITDLLTGTMEVKNAWVQFDDIDLTNIDNPKLTFYQDYKALNQAFSYLDISTDGGQTFTQEVLLNDGVEGNSYGDDFYEIILTNYIANESDVSLRFRWQTTEATQGGYGYGWEIDDIKIVDNFDVDMKLQGIYMNFFEYVDYTVPGNEDYFHISSHYGMIPIDQFNSDTAAMLFNAKVENGGNLDNTPELQVQVFDPTGTEVYNESASGDLLSVTEKDTIDLITPEFKPASPVVGKYTVIFNINVDGDENPDNNADTTFFIVTEEAFARDLGHMTSYTGPSAWLDGGTDGDMVGTNYLYLDGTDDITSMSIYIASNTDPGTSLVGHLMQYDADLEQWQDLMTTSLVNITEDSIGKWIDLEFPAAVPVVLEEGSFNVKAAVEFFYGGEENELMIGYDGTVPASAWGTQWYFNSGSSAGEWFSISNWSRGGVGIRLNSMNEPEQNQANILTYTFPQHSGAPIVIDQGAQTVDIEVEYAADLSNLVATYNLSYGATATVGTTEQQSGYTANDFTSPVTYAVLAQDSVTSKDWVVTVTKADPSTEAEIMNFGFDEATGPGIVDTVANTVDVEVEYGTNMTTLVANFALSDYATATVGGVDQISGETPNDFTNPVTYTITAQDGVTTQDYTVTVTEEPPSTENELIAYMIPEQVAPADIDDVSHTIDLDVLFGTNVTALIATFEISDFATAEVGGVVQESGVTPNDFTNPVTYTIIAQDGITTQDWTVTVTVAPPNTETDILAYSFTEQTGPANIDDVNHTVDIEVAFGTDVNGLVATFVLSDYATAEIGGVEQESEVTANDFTNPVTYTVIAQDGTTTQDWTVTVTVAAGSTETDFFSYTFDEETGPADINPVTHTIDIEVAFGTDVTSLVAEFTLSDFATAEVGGVVQESGVTENDFTDPVTYTVIAQEVTVTQDWTVTVTVAAGSTETDFLAYSFDEQTDPADIDAVSHTIVINVPTDTAVTSLVAEFTLSTGATADIGGTPQVSDVTVNDFTAPVTYTVMAEDGVTTQDWEVTVTVGVGIEDMLNADLTIYPNPTDGKVIVEMYLNQSKDVSLSIISTTGQVISHQEYKNVSEVNSNIDLGDVANGVYTLRIQADGKQLNRKIVLNK